MPYNEQAVCYTAIVEMYFSGFLQKLDRLDEGLEWVQQNVDDSFEHARDALKRNVPQIRTWFNDLRRRDLFVEGSLHDVKQIREAEKKLCGMFDLTSSALGKLAERELYKHDEAKTEDLLYQTQRSEFIDSLSVIIGCIVTALDGACKALSLDQERHIVTDKFSRRNGAAVLKAMFMTACASIYYLSLHDATKWSSDNYVMQTWGMNLFDGSFTLGLRSTEPELKREQVSIVLATLCRILFHIGKH
jgi:hypothetical protein